METLDFYGFTFDGEHSKEMGFYRVSGGDRYQEDMIPQFSDKTVVVPGGDGTYFFGSNYTQRQFQIQIAYDDISEAQFRDMRQLFTKDKIGRLIFDEWPYKYYMAKVQSPPQLNYICFDKEVADTDDESVVIHNHTLNPRQSEPAQVVSASTERVYRGEGTIQFVCYYPFARSVSRNSGYFSEYSNVNEWLNTSGIASEPQISGRDIIIYNPGDLATDFKAFYAGNAFPSSVYLTNGDTNLGQISFSTISNPSDQYICINSRTNLIEGYNSLDGAPTGNLYNQYITSGDFFKLPIVADASDSSVVFHSSGNDCVQLDYDFLYY